MRQVLGVARITLIALIILLGVVVIAVVDVTGVRYRQVPLPTWIVTWMARCFDLLFNVRVRCKDPASLRQHHGFIVPNHVSYLDVIVLLHLWPTRFLAAIEVKERPVIGWLAAAIGAIFVNRKDRNSRQRAAQAIIERYQDEPDPPIVIFPEGRLGPGNRLHPFSLGVFRIAQRSRIAYLPCAIGYDRPDIAVWHGGQGERLLQAVWRLAAFPGPLHVTVTPLSAVTPQPGDSTVALADATQIAIERTLGIGHAEGVHENEGVR